MPAFELCPNCVRRYQDPRTGLCEDCYKEHLRVKQAEVGLEKTDGRRAWWRDRQRKHRKDRRLRPQEPLPMDTDPLEVGAATLELLENLRSELMKPQQVAMLDEISEGIKQLAWGPEPQLKAVGGKR